MTITCHGLIMPNWNLCYSKSSNNQPVWLPYNNVLNLQGFPSVICCV